MTDETQDTREACERALAEWDREIWSSAGVSVEEAARLAEALRATLEREKAARDAALEGCAALLDQRADAEVGASERMAMTQAARLRFQYAATVLRAVSAHIRALKSEPSR